MNPASTSRAWVATRKGLFKMQRARDTWQVSRVSFLGEPVSMVLPPHGGGCMLADLCPKLGVTRVGKS